MDFETAYETYKHEISVLCHTQRVPGMDCDDIHSEMLISLWKACTTYRSDRNDSFGSWWWTVWRNRRIDLLKVTHAAKKVHAIPVGDDLPDVAAPPLKINVPPTNDLTGTFVWNEIANGATVRETLETVGISKRSYYSLIKSWRSPDVHVHILDS